MFGLKALFTSNGPSWPPSSSTAPTMIFGTRMSYLTSRQILENKARSPVPEEDWVKGTFTFYSISTKIHKNSSPYHIVKDGVSCTPGAGAPPSPQGGASIPALHHRVIQVYSVYYIFFVSRVSYAHNYQWIALFKEILASMSKSRWIGCAWEVLIENLCEKFDIIQVCVCTAATDPR